MVETRPPRLRVSPVRIPKASDILAEQIKADIILGNVPEGSQLPSERELVEQLGVSRPTVRDALRLLEMEGLIALKPGRNGGAITRAPRHDSVTKPLALLLQFQKATLHDLLEARRYLEPICARLAAERYPEDEIQRLEASVAHMRDDLTDSQVFLAENVSFHLNVAVAGGNTVLRTFMNALRDVIYDFTYDAPIDPEDRGRTAEEHEAIISAIRARDADGAAAAMERHIESFERRICAYYGDLHGRMLYNRSRPVRILSNPAS